LWGKDRSTRRLSEGKKINARKNVGGRGVRDGIGGNRPGRKTNLASPLPWDDKKGHQTEGTGVDPILFLGGHYWKR